jgi:hypothetical protein
MSQLHLVGNPEAGDQPMTSSKKGRDGGKSSSLQTGTGFVPGTKRDTFFGLVVP